MLIRATALRAADALFSFNMARIFMFEPQRFRPQINKPYAADRPKPHKGNLSANNIAITNIPNVGNDRVKNSLPALKHLKCRLNRLSSPDQTIV